MKKLLLILLCVPLMFSCVENNKDKKENEYWDNGKLKIEYSYDNEDIMVGYKKYYEDGQLESEITMPLPRRYYYRTGELKNEIFNENGKLNQINYFKDGEIENETVKDHKTKISIDKMYFKNGQLRFETQETETSILSKRCWDKEGNEIECE
jgi:antitoxin component YwqK of YwqJK toxin-antitoxin module